MVADFGCHDSRPSCSVVRAAETLGIYVLYNNADTDPWGRVEEGAEDEITDQRGVNSPDDTRGASRDTAARIGAHRQSLFDSGAGGMGAGFYVASKLAREGLSESLAGKVEPLGMVC